MFVTLSTKWVTRGLGLNVRRRLCGTGGARTTLIPSQRARVSSVGNPPSFSFSQVDMYATGNYYIFSVFSPTEIVLLADFNAKLPRNTNKRTGRWCIHNRANPAGTRLLELMDRLQLCAVSTIHQPCRGSNNATYLSKDLRYGPSQIDYILVSCRWASSAQKCCVKVGSALPL